MIYIVGVAHIVFAIIFSIALILFFIIRKRLENLRKIKYLLIISIVLFFSVIGIGNYLITSSSKLKTNDGLFSDGDSIFVECNENSIVLFRFKVDVDGYEDVTINYIMKIYNPNEELIKSYKSEKQVDVDSHTGGGSVSDEIIFYTTLSGNYTLTIEMSSEGSPTIMHYHFNSIPLVLDLTLDSLMMISYLLIILASIISTVKLTKIKTGFNIKIEKINMGKENVKTIVISSVLVIVNVVIAYKLPFPLAVFFVMVLYGLASGSSILFPLYYYFVPLILILGLLFVILGIKKIGGILCIISGILTLPIGILGIIAGVIGMNLSKKKD